MIFYWVISIFPFFFKIYLYIERVVLKNQKEIEHQFALFQTIHIELKAHTKYFDENMPQLRIMIILKNWLLHNCDGANDLYISFQNVVSK